MLQGFMFEIKPKSTYLQTTVAVDFTYSWKIIIRQVNFLYLHCCFQPKRWSQHQEKLEKEFEIKEEDLNML